MAPCRQMRKAKRHRRKRNSNKGKLIKGMTKKLPASFFEDPAFEEALEKVMKNYSGIYALYSGDDLYYVGLTNNLLKRTTDHLDDRHSGRWDTFKVFRIKNVKYLKDVETLILQIRSTPGNKQTGRVPRKYNLNGPFKTALKQIKRRIRSFERALK